MTTLRTYQNEAVQFLTEHGRAIYGDAPGTGKTASTLCWLHENNSLRTLIVAPLPVLGHWEREAARWYPDLHVVRGTGTPKQRVTARTQVDDAGRSRGETTPTALLVNYETLRGDIDALTGVRWDAFVADEAHRLKNRNAQVTKASVKVAKIARYLALVTGTPILNRPDEIWSLLRLCAPRSYKTYWGWVEGYCETERTTFYGRSPRPVTLIHGLKPERIDDLREEVAGYLLQRPLETLLPDLPETTEIMLPVTLSPAERRAYDQLAAHAWAEVPGGIVTTRNEVSKITRLRQLASDWSGLAAEQVKLGTKAQAALELIADLDGEQVVVLSSYKAAVYALHNALEGKGVRSACYTGDQSSGEREDALGSFKCGDTQVLVGTIATMGEGVDGLQVARRIIMLDRDWTPARNEQAVARVRRSGQEHDAVFVHQIYAENTIDETVAEALHRKVDVIAAVLGGA